MQVVVPLAFCILLFGCGKKFKRDPAKEITNIEEPQAEDKEPILKELNEPSFEIIQKEELGRYQIKISNPFSYPIAVRRISLISNEELEFETEAGGEFLDWEVKTGESYLYEFGKFSGDGSFQKLGEKTLFVPLDIVFKTKEGSLEEFLDKFKKTNSGVDLLRISRLVLLNGATLTTDGRDLFIEVDHLYSDEGSIQTLKPSLKASKVGKAKSGGTLQVAVKKATGSLNIILAGENGAHASRPSQLGESGRGKKGIAGNPGKAEATIHECFNGPLLGAPTEGRCLKQPGPGGPGGKGLTGKKGKNGKPGGDTGSAVVLIDDSEDLKLSFTFIPGLGGKGSLGGVGGPGGFGGDSGEEVTTVFRGLKCGDSNDRYSHHDRSSWCRHTDGKMGPAGDTGPPGVKGANGVIQKACFKFNKNEDLKCVQTNFKGESNES